jgi:hypothetical protein
MFNLRPNTVKFNFMVVLACFLLLIFAGNAKAVSYSYNGICYDSPTAVLQAFNESFPLVTSGTIYQLSGTPTFVAPTLTFIIQHKAYTTATWTTDPSSTVTLRACLQTDQTQSIEGLLTTNNGYAQSTNQLQVTIGTILQQILIANNSENASLTSINNAEQAQSAVLANQLVAMQTQTAAISSVASGISSLRQFIKDPACDNFLMTGATSDRFTCLPPSELLTYCFLFLCFVGGTLLGVQSR